MGSHVGRGDRSVSQPVPDGNELRTRLSNGGTGNVHSMAMAARRARLFIGGNFYYSTASRETPWREVSTDDGSLINWRVQVGNDPERIHEQPLSGPERRLVDHPDGDRRLHRLRTHPERVQSIHHEHERIDRGVRGRWVRDNTVDARHARQRRVAGPERGRHPLVRRGSLRHEHPRLPDHVQRLDRVDPRSLQREPPHHDQAPPICDWFPQIVPFGGKNAPGSHVNPPNAVGAFAMQLSSSALFVGGYFTSISGVPQAGFARFTLSGSPPPPPPVPTITSFIPRRARSAAA